MEERNLELLNEVISEQLKNLKNIEPGSQDHIDATESLAKLYKLKIEEETSIMEIGNKINQSKKENRNSIIKMSVEVAGIVLPLVFYASWMNKGFKFEQTGTFTSTTFRGLFQKFKTTK